MYWIQKIVSACTEPLIVALMLVLLAALLRFIRPRLVTGCLMVALSVIYLGSIGLVASLLQGPLERRYPQLRATDVPTGVQHIVVLGSGYSPDENHPITAALDESGLIRIVEGVRLRREFDIANLIVTGGAPKGLAASATGYAILARSLGVDPAAITVLDHPLDTAEEARAVVATIGATPFILVTSAYHMPRAMLLMERAGAQAIPAPSGQDVAAWSGFKWKSLLPNSIALRRTERALHEYLALLALTFGIE